MKVKSYIANNTWTVEGSKTIGNNENGVVSIIIPKGFHAKKAVMKLTAGNILVSGLSADNTKVEVGMGKCEIKNMYSQHLNMKCGMGDIVGSCSMNGDVNVDCGMGNVTLTLTNSADNLICRRRQVWDALILAARKFMVQEVSWITISARCIILM